MLSRNIFITRLLLCLALPACGAFAPVTCGQQNQTDDVIRVTTELIQTDVTVFDKQGRFIDGLRPEQFTLRVNGKPQAISFFERVTAGSVNEEAQLAAARGVARRTASDKDQTSPKPLDRGRTIYFFVDDLHLSPDSVPRTRALLLRFIEREMGQNDEVAITSASGQIGFLQQLTNEKAVLRAAVERLNARQRNVRDFERPPMTEYQALLVDRYDREVTDYFVERVLADNPGIGRDAATNIVRGRAQTILQQASAITVNTLATLESLVRASTQLAGRKLVFFISDGFFLDDRTSSTTSRIRQIASAAARAGSVIYSIDARGLVASLEDASSEVAVDPTGRLARAGIGELNASQDALNALAADTGGRFIFNTNAPFPAVSRALEETSIYYLLAWRPDTEEQKTGKFQRIEVSVVGRPDLTVRVRRGFIENEMAKTASRDKKPVARDSAKLPDEELRAAINALYPKGALPTSLSLNYLDSPKDGAVLTVSMQIPTGAVKFDSVADKLTAAIDVAGVIFNDQGKPGSSFRERLDVTSAHNATPQDRNIVYNYQVRLKPGLYQARVAARDDRSGRTGSATQWIEIPDLASRRLTMSSLIVGEHKGVAESATKSAASASEQVNLSVDRRFARDSRLRFLTYIYNAARGTDGKATPDVAIQMQVFRDDQPVVTTALRKVDAESTPDPARLPYAAEIALDALPAGNYALQVTVIDRIAKTTASQRLKFEIE